MRFVQLFLLGGFITMSSMNYAQKVQDLDKNNAESVIAQSKVIIVDFYADWCPPCKMMKPIFEQVAANDTKGYVFAKVNAETVPDLARHYRVTAYPTFVVIKNGSSVGKIVGARSSADEFAQAVEDVIARDGQEDNSPEALTDLMQQVIPTGTAQELESLIKRGADVNRPLKNGMPPLIFTLTVGTPVDGVEKIKLLIDAGVQMTVTIPGQGEVSVIDLVDRMMDQYQKVIDFQKEVRQLITEKDKKRSMSVESSLDKDDAPKKCTGGVCTLED